MSVEANDRITSPFNATSTAQEVARGIDLTGRTAIVTGGASGIGGETARVLAQAGASVTIAARNMDAAQGVAAQINRGIGEDRVSCAYLELGDLQSVRAFAAAWGDRPLNLLINNAGVMACPLGHTTDGFETQLGVNHLGHFLLANLLAPALVKGAPSRLVVLSSSAHIYSDVDLDDPHYRSRAYHPFKAYGQSKTANALFAVEFDRRYRDRGVRAFSVMPGVIETALMRHMTDALYRDIGAPPPGERSGKGMKTTGQGAATSVWAAVGPELDGKGGLYLENCAQARPFDRDRPRGGVRAYALDPDRAKRFWTLSEEEVGLARTSPDEDARIARAGGD